MSLTGLLDLEALLLRYQALEKPSSALRIRREEDSDLDDDLGDEVGTVNARKGGVRSGGVLAAGARRRGADSDGSDLDL